jgi:hypothetical protein
LAAALRHSSLAKQSSDAEGFLPLHTVAGAAKLHVQAIRLAVQFSHKAGTPRFQMVTVPTVDGDQEYVRATSGHSFEVTDDIVSILQNAAREARRASRLPPALPVAPPPLPGPQEPDVGPSHPQGMQPATSSSSASAVVPPAEAHGVFASVEELSLSTDLAPKTEGVLPVSLVDDAVP